MPACQTDAAAFQRLLLDMAHARSLEALLVQIVTRLTACPDVALARIWLMGPGDICATCRMRPECPDQTRCLHLVASHGLPVARVEEDWTRLDGRFRRFPVGVRKVGHTAATREPVVVWDTEKDSRWLADPEWARAENIQGFVGQPILYRDGDVLGVLGAFFRAQPTEELVPWLRIIADHAASAIKNAEAFGEIERLKIEVELENEYLREEVDDAHTFGDIVGQSEPLRNVLRQIELVAPTDASVLILGESGTGKELVAREIHRRGERGKHRLVRVNCASIPRELYESEFFGHVKGAFTGAVRDRVGRFELADGGTLFLDEVGEIPLELQSKLLRVLQEGQYERVGEDRTRQTDVRIVAATNRDLKEEVEAGRFRQDLFYRLNVFPIEISPLRRRKEDIPLLATHFLEQAAARLNRSVPPLTQANVMALQGYDWPGNVRELQNVIERAVITSSSRLRFDLPVGEASVGAASPPADDPERILTEAEMKELERKNLRAALEHAGGRIYGDDGAAELLGMKPTTLASRVKKLGLRASSSRD